MNNFQNLLSPGTIKTIHSGNGTVSEPWVQFIFIKLVEREPNSGTSASGQRWKVALSDGINFIQGLILAPATMLFEQKTIEQNDIARIVKYSVANLRGHKVVLIQDISSSNVIKQSVKIGDPQNIESSPISSQSTTANLIDNSFISTSTSPVPTSASAAITSSNSAGIISTGGLVQASLRSFAQNQSIESMNNTSNISNDYGIVGGVNRSEMMKNTAVQNISFLGAVNPGGNVVHTTSMQAPSQQNKSTDESVVIHPISGISPYHNKWTIKARVSHKTDIKKWVNNRGEGRLFSFTLIDESGEIRATAFNDVVDKFYNLIQPGSVYLISNGSVKIAKRQFNANNDYEIHLESSTIIQPTNDTSSIPSIQYNFVPIADIVERPKDSLLDVLAIIKEFGELTSVTAKSTGKPLSKRDLTLVDSSHSTIRMTVWGSFAENLDTSIVNPVIAIRNARVSDFNNRSLSTHGASTDITIEPQTQEAFKIKKWYESIGKSEHCTPLTFATGAMGGAGGSTTFNPSQEDRKTISMIKEDNQHVGDRPEYYSLNATITYIKSDAPLSYTACPKEDCNKKVIEEGPSIWRCEKCNRTYDKCDHRYILNLQVSDHTGQIWINTFNDTGNAIIGRTAEEMYNLKQIDEGQFNETVKNASFKEYNFRIKSKQENYQGEVKIRNSILSLSSLNFAEESRKLLMLIDQIQ